MAASLRDLRRKIKSIRGTQKITSAMQLVAASKMQRAIRAATNTRSYTDAIQTLMGQIVPLGQSVIDPLFIAREPKELLVLVITTNRGWVGALNTQLMRMFTDWERTQRAAGRTVRVVIVGTKGRNYFARYSPDSLAAAFDATDRLPVFSDVSPIAQLLIEEFSSERADAVYLMYNKFISTLRQEPTVEPFLPFAPSPLKETQAGSADDQTVFEPSPTEIIRVLVPKALRMHLYQIALETYASEQSARMLAMKNATDNASELVDDLSFTYNSLRQASITAELLDIASGAAALA